MSQDNGTGEQYALYVQARIRAMLDDLETRQDLRREQLAALGGYHFAIRNRGVDVLPQPCGMSATFRPPFGSTVGALKCARCQERFAHSRIPLSSPIIWKGDIKSITDLSKVQLDIKPSWPHQLPINYSMNGVGGLIIKKINA